ncbi:hypothetical protein LR48_Vigan02g252500 [Vigna angularis]|uniref:ACT domain-containing protein ACR n=1 Tax=Phaseolus angularis TaxID=3914 RepID=A0A0L9U0Q5_PHAAN|nr:hypothetical protein LR48_Vigan02g252500 [Vigna angularis]
MAFTNVFLAPSFALHGGRVSDPRSIPLLSPPSDVVFRSSTSFSRNGNIIFASAYHVNAVGSASLKSSDNPDNVPMPIVLIDQDSDSEATIVQLSFGDRLGALLDTMKALKDLGLDVSKGTVSTEGLVKQTKFFITQSHGHVLSKETCLGSGKSYFNSMDHPVFLDVSLEDGRDVSSVVTALYVNPLKFISQGYASSGSLHSLDLGDDGLKFARVHHEAFPICSLVSFFISFCYVLDTGRKVEDPDMLERIRLTIINNLLKYHPESSELLAMGEVFGIKSPKKKRNEDIKTHIQVKEDGPKRSLLCIETADKPGLLVEIIRVISDVNIDVESAEIDTEGLVAKDKFHVSYGGAALNSSMSQVLVNCLRYYLRTPDTDIDSY